MSFQRLEQHKINPALSNLLSRLESQLESYLRRPPHGLESFFDSPSHDIRPKQIAGALGIPFEKAIVLLEICAKAGILERRYEVRCPDTGELIDRYAALGDVPAEIDCPHHDEGIEWHSIADYNFEIVYEFTKSVVEDFLLAAA